MKKALIKTITYRALGSLTSMIIAYASTKNFTLGVTVGAADLLIKPLIYYIHEMLWERKVDDNMPF
jgi:uncharacterized membrane protein